MAYDSKDKQPLDELFRTKGEGQLLVGYETGRGIPYAETSYWIRPAVRNGEQASYPFISVMYLELQKARRSAFIPDMRIEQYAFPDMREVPSPEEWISVKEYIIRELLPFITERGIKPEVSVNLRDMAFASSENLQLEPGGMLRLDAGQIDRLMEFRRKQDALALQYDYVPEYRLPLHVVETSRGVLVFSDSKTGNEGLSRFYQYLADNYFSGYGESGPLIQYKVDCPSGLLYPFIDKTCGINPVTGKEAFDFRDSLFSQTDKASRENWEPVFISDMKPTADSYRQLVDFGKCRMKGDNADIYRLLTLRNHFDRDIILDPAFGYRSRFKDFITRMDNSVNGLSPGESMGKILDEIRLRADNILKTKFRIRDSLSATVKGNNKQKTIKVGNRQLKLQ